MAEHQDGKVYKLAAHGVSRETCKHGGPEDKNLIDAEERITAINEYLHREDEVNERYRRHGIQSELMTERSKLFEVFWKMVNMHLVDDLLFSILYANATEFVLDGQMIEARRNLILAISLTRLKNNESLTAESVMADVQTILTDRGLVLFLWRNIPCSCLAEKKQEAKRSSKTFACFSCKKEVAAEKIKKCKKCKRACYCSKQCQKDDWGGHKEDCKMLR